VFILDAVGWLVVGIRKNGPEWLSRKMLCMPTGLKKEKQTITLGLALRRLCRKSIIQTLPVRKRLALVHK